jgi:D-serine dehydratase
MAVVALGVAARAEGDGLTVARLCGWAGALLVAAYAPLSAAVYASQYTVFEWLLRRDPAAAAPWFFLNEHGVVVTFELLAYAIWGAGALLVAWPLLAHGGALRWLSWSLALSGALSVAAFGLYALGVGAAGTLSVVSGVLAAVFGAAALVHGVRLAKRSA